MASLQKKIKNGRPYWYVIEVARVDGQPRVVRQRYLGTVEAIEAAFDSAFEPMSIEVVEFGASAAAWGMASRIGVGLAVDASVTKRSQGLTVGTYLQAAAVNRVVAPRSKRGFITWYDQSVVSRLLPASPEAWSSQRFWDAMHKVREADLQGIEEAIVSSTVEGFGIEMEALVFDATNFHTFIATTNPKVPIAQRGHAKNKRHDLRLVGLALACSRDHQIPLASKLVAGNTPDVRSFEATLPLLVRRLEAVGVDASSVTVVFDKGNDSKANFEALSDTGMGFVGSLVPTQHPDLLAVADEAYEAVEDLAGVTAWRGTKEIFGVARTVVVTRSQSFLEDQLVGLAQTRRRVETQLGELVRLLEGHRHKMDQAKLTDRVAEALSPRWMRRLYRCEITGEGKEDLALAWSFDEAAFETLAATELGKRIIFTDRGSWSTRDIIVAYRSQWEVEAAFRQMHDPHHAAFRPIYHWTDHKIRVHGLYSVAALIIVNLLWREADRAGLGLSPRETLEALASIREVTLVYPPARARGQPRVRHKLTRMDQTQQRLFELFELDAFAPRVGNTAKWRGFGS